MDKLLKEHSAVVLRFDIPELGLLAGTVGVIVHVYPGGLAYEVEFFGDSLSSARVETFKFQALTPLG